MMHTGNIYEQRARAARNRELRALANAVSSFFFGAAPSKSLRRGVPANDVDFAKEQRPRNNRAA